ncbi:hypothetical protein FACS189490_04060 [Clostridia bacterium]|nr:hypothetical protein FACS189490_04060 [Clostridia bacterium]
MYDFEQEDYTEEDFKFIFDAYRSYENKFGKALYHVWQNWNNASLTGAAMAIECVKNGKPLTKKQLKEYFEFDYKPGVTY